MIFYYLEFLNNLMDCFIYIIIRIFGNSIFFKIIYRKDLVIYISSYRCFIFIDLYYLKKK